MNIVMEFVIWLTILQTQNIHHHQVVTHALITPKFPSGSSHESDGDYIEKWMLAHHFSHYYSQRCRWRVSKLAGVISPSVIYPEDFPLFQKPTYVHISKSLHIYMMPTFAASKLPMALHIRVEERTLAHNAWERVQELRCNLNWDCLYLFKCITFKITQLIRLQLEPLLVALERLSNKTREGVKEQGGLTLCKFTRVF